MTKKISVIEDKNLFIFCCFKSFIPFLSPLLFVTICFNWKEKKKGGVLLWSNKNNKTGKETKILSFTNATRLLTMWLHHMSAHAQRIERSKMVLHSQGRHLWMSRDYVLLKISHFQPTFVSQHSIFFFFFIHGVFHEVLTFVRFHFWISVSRLFIYLFITSCSCLMIT